MRKILTAFLSVLFLCLSSVLSAETNSVKKDSPVAEQTKYLEKQAAQLCAGKKYSSAIETYKKILVIKPNDKSALYNIACSYSLLGQKNEAIVFLEKSVQAGFSPLEHVKNDPDLQNLQGDERFKKILNDLQKREDSLSIGEIDSIIAPDYISPDNKAFEHPIKETGSFSVNANLEYISLEGAKILSGSENRLVSISNKGAMDNQCSIDELKDNKGLTLHGDFLYAVSDNKLVRINRKVGEVVQTLDLPPSEYSGMASDGKQLLIADKKNRKIISVNPENAAVTKEIPTPSGDLVDLAFFKDYILVIDGKDKTLYVLSKDGYVILWLILDYTPKSIASNKKQVWIAGEGKIRLYRIDTKRKIHLKNKLAATVRYSSNGGPIALPWKMNRQKIVGKIKVVPETRVIKDKWEQPAVDAIKIEARTEIYQTQYFVWPHFVKSPDSIPKNIKNVYLADDALFQISSAEVQQGKKWITRDGSEKNYYILLQRAYQYATEHMYYAREFGWIPAPEALRKGRGTCSPNAFVFVALCRASGIPARLQAGTRYRGTDPGLDTEFHRWSEVYIPGYGWIAVDSSSAGQMPTPAKRAACFGYIPNTDLIMTMSGGVSDIFGISYNAPKSGTANWFNVKTEK